MKYPKPTGLHDDVSQAIFPLLLKIAFVYCNFEFFIELLPKRVFYMKLVSRKSFETPKSFLENEFSGMLVFVLGETWRLEREGRKFIYVSEE